MRPAYLLPLSALLLLSACVVPTGPVEVTRYNRIADGVVYGSGSYSVAEGGDPKASSGLAASPYLAAVAREMQRVGYGEKLSGGDVIAQVDVNSIDRGPPARSPVSVGVGGSTGSYGSGVGLGIGIDLSGRGKAQVETTLSVRLVRQIDKVVVWEGRAVQSAGKGTPAAQPGIAASKLAAALFQGFPGKSGETIRVP